jgi:HNH endonuclease
MTEDLKEMICDFVDHLMPELTPYESSLYFLFFRMSFLQNGSPEVRIGKKRVTKQLGTSSRAAAKISFYQVTEVLKGLEGKGCITVGDTNREGTLYMIIRPREVPLVKEKLASAISSHGETDYFKDPDKRLELFERDNWICQYCGERTTKDNVTLDHYVPQSKSGGHSKENLRTCCLACNSIKSGKSFEEAAPLILKSIQERKQRLHK